MNMYSYDNNGIKKLYKNIDKMLYDEDGHKILINLNRGIIGYGLYGVVYQLGTDKCLKYISNDSYSHPEIIKEIMNMDLNNFYKIYKILYDNDNYFSGYIMKYYENIELDILSSQVDYTLSNFYNLTKDIEKISNKFILLKDMHSENIILDKDKIIVIDIDNSIFSLNSNIYLNNIISLYNLFKNLYIDQINKYHKHTLDELSVIKRLFTYRSNYNIYDELKNYKYPIDYIKKKSLEPVKYIMKKGM